MVRLTLGDIYFIGSFVEAFFYGLYTGIFAMYLQYHSSKKDMNKTQNIIFYSICALYVLSVAVFACDMAACIFWDLLVREPNSGESLLRIAFVQTTSFACCDFIAQCILIYRCWIVWGRNIRVVVIPSTLTFAFLATWLACSGSQYISSNQLLNAGWSYPVFLTSLVMSLTVNALVTGLIVFRIFKVFREVKSTSDDQILGTTGGNKLRRIIFIIIESGMALFSIQLARLVVSTLQTDAATIALYIIIAIHEMLIGITPTIILVRTSMGLSFHDEKSMEEVAIGSLRFESNHPNPVPPEMGSISLSVVNRDSRDDDDDIGRDVQPRNDIDVVER